MMCLASDIFSCIWFSLAASSGFKLCQPRGPVDFLEFQLWLQWLCWRADFISMRNLIFSIVFLLLCVDLSTFAGGQLCLGRRLLAALVAQGEC